MLKFFRKYRGWILAVGGSLLMVVFLLGGILDRLTQIGPSQTIATINVDGEVRKFRYTEQNRAGAELQMFERTFPEMLPRIVDPLGEAILSGETEALANATHWYLLKLEAERAGLIGGTGDARNWLMNQATAAAAMNESFRGDPDRAYRAITRNLMNAAQMPERDILEAIAAYLGVERLVSAYYAAPIASDYRVQQLASTFLRGVNISYVLIDAESLIEEIDEPSEEDMAVHFEQYRAAEPGSGEYGFGYRQPDRVKLEYLEIDYESVLDQIPESGLEARLWYEANRDRLPLPPGETEPAPYEEVMDDAMASYRREKALERMDDVMGEVKARLLRSTRGLQRDGEYRLLPDGWADQRVSFATLKDEIEAEYGVEVEYHDYTEEWIDADAPGDIGPIRSAFRQLGSNRMTMSNFLQSVRAFGEPVIPGIQAGVADIEPLRMEQPVTEFTGTQRRERTPTDAYFYRITDADPERPADSLDEVREDVVRDLKTLTAYRTLQDNIEMWRARALEEGVDKVAEDLDKRVNPARVSRLDRYALQFGEGFVPSRAGELGRSQALTDAVMAIADEIDDVGSLEQIDEAERTTVVAIDQQLGLALVRLENIRPMDKESLQSLINSGLRVANEDRSMTRQYGIADVLVRRQLDADFENPFSYDAMLERYQFEPVREVTTEDDEGEGSLVGGPDSESEDDETAPEEEGGG